MLKRSVTVLAPAKLNLSLDVVGTLPNGYHDLDMVMQTIDLYEKITLRRSNGLSLTLPGSFVPVNDKNTAIKAAVAFFRYTGLLAGVDMTIYKRVPVRAGMAGGSADAAGVLVGLNELYDAHLSMSELCAIGAGIFLITRLVSKPLSKEEARAKAGIVYDSSATEGGWDNLSPEEIEARLNEKVAEGMINISANTAPIFEDGSSEGNLMLVNESINNYPQKVQIVRNDTGEQIYESGAIAVGSKIERAKLDVVLPAGTYECTAYFHNLDPDSGAIIGTAGAIITITIQH